MIIAEALMFLGLLVEIIAVGYLGYRIGKFFRKN